ncbi:hypothetical protein CPBP_00798 [Candidatus Bodocaedibacter vickermanii]|uniref:Uncharacterized protein n=2 Tax=Candidatus Bodocaedibacter vickermanii TaxID=2741701 RepID=A0A7L9RU21_9PROT|nr:hypothetical protein CPBP_00798 [Candidatus Paracaedibacteraceae bacterium 'Lake Konstanz']
MCLPLQNHKREAISSPDQKPNKPQHIDPLKRSISLDVGYLPSLNSNRAIGEFDLDLRQVRGALYDWQNDEWHPSDFVGRSILYSLFSMLTWGPTMGQMATYHAFGHSTRFRSIGVDTSFVNTGKTVWSVYQNGIDKTKVGDCLSDNYFSTLGGVSAISAIVPIAWMGSAILPRPNRDLLFVPKDADYHYDVSKFKADGAGIKKI